MTFLAKTFTCHSVERPLQTLALPSTSHSVLLLRFPPQVPVLRRVRYFLHHPHLREVPVPLSPKGCRYDSTRHILSSLFTATTTTDSVYFKIAIYSCLTVLSNDLVLTHFNPSLKVGIWFSIRFIKDLYTDTSFSQPCIETFNLRFIRRCYYFTDG